MKGTECDFIRYLEGSDKRFVIPVYQRNYDWKVEHCRQLYDDLVKTIRENRRRHFFGSIVSVYDSNASDIEVLVIDGQQRITTVSLLLLAMCNLLEKGVVVSSKSNLGQKILEEYLIDKWQTEEKKLKPVKNDKLAFSKLFDKTEDYVRESNLTVNYEYFFKRIQQQEITIDELYEAICRLQIIDIKLNHDDNPQLIFESLNSTGLDLSEADKIRNFILMNLSAKDQEYYYENYWNPIEIHTKYDVSSFIRDYLTIKHRALLQKNKIYVEFKIFFENAHLDTKSLLDDMLTYAKRYEILIGKSNSGECELDNCILRLNRLETTVTRPYFLEVLRLRDENKFTLAQVTEIFKIVESYLFRGIICDLPMGHQSKVFPFLHREIIRYDGTDDNYVEKLKYALLSRKERARFPDNNEFVTKFSQRNIYSMQSKNKIYILERFENFGTLETKDIYEHCDNGTYSIEHIMPQHLTPLWQRELGDDYERIHKEYLDRIANLTLTAYNSKYSNDSFTNKKTMQNGFIESGIRLNQWLAQKNKWTESELEERNNYLMGLALKIWAAPVTSYKSEKKQLKTFSLDDDAELLTGRSIVKFAFKNTEQPVTSWIEMYQNVMQILYAEDKTIITRLAVSKNDKISIHFSTNTNAFQRYIQLDDGIYLNKTSSTQNKLYVLNNLFKLYNEDPASLVFYLRDENEADSES